MNIGKPVKVVEIPEPIPAPAFAPPMKTPEPETVTTRRERA